MKLMYSILFVSTLTVVNAQDYRRIPPAIVIREAIKAMGTEQKLSAIENIQFTGYGYRNLLEQSERFEGPYIPSQFTFHLTLGLKDTVGHFRQNEKLYTFQTRTSYLMDGNAVAFMSQDKTVACPQDQLIMDDLHLNPLVLFQKALNSPSLNTLPDTIVQRIAHHRVRFLWKTFPVTISINTHTYLPTLVEIEKPYSDNYLDVWGDLKKVIHYSFWDLLDNGVHYPRQKDVYFNGQLWESTLITELKYNQPLSPDSMRIPANVMQAISNINQKNRTDIQKMMDSKIEIASNIWLLPGFCNSTIVNQNNELTVIESPNTSENTEMIIAQAGILFPGAVLKQVITTSDAWLHCGGVRAAANRTTVIALKENEEIIEALLKAKHETQPDAWQMKKGKDYVINYVKARTTVGNGANRMELIPYRTEAGGRMMMVHFPELRLLYASDLLQPGNWQKHYTLEVIEAIHREKLDVETIYAMHLKPTPYSKLLKQMESYLPNSQN